jgi:FAD:protein FMN transferase
MRALARLLVLFAIGLGTQPSAAAGARPAFEEYLTVDEALALAFPKADRVEQRTAVLTEEERLALEPRLRARKAPRIVRYYVGTKDKRCLGYALVDEVLGKSQPITYFLRVEPDLTIKSVEILAYRESHGGEIRREKFREQFVGKSPASVLRLQADIRNISGATISCRSLTDGVHDLLVILELCTRLPGQSGAPVEPAPAGPAAEGGPFARSQLLMGTTLKLQVFASERAAADRACDAAFQEVARLERLLSNWRPESEISALARLAGKAPLPVSPETFELLQRAQTLSRETLGAFDVCCGPLVELWKSAAASQCEPTAGAVDSARALGGIAQLELDASTRTARLQGHGARIDPGGIGKGFALERAALELERLGAKAALLDFGGQILALDPPPGREAWPVEIRDPRDPERSLAFLELVRASVSTTSDDQRGLELAGRRISHVVDPRTGQPACGLASASVVCAFADGRGAAEADAWSTAMFVLGAGAGLPLARDRGLAVLLLTDEGSVLRSETFARFERPRESAR